MVHTRAGKRKRKGEKGPRAAKRALVLREESVLPSILEQGVGSSTLGGACAHEEPAAAGIAAARTLQQRTQTPEKSLNLGMRIKGRRAVGAFATKTLIPPQLPSGSAARCRGERRGFDDTEPKHIKHWTQCITVMDPPVRDPEVAWRGSELKNCGRYESRGPRLTLVIMMMFVMTAWLFLFSGNPAFPPSPLINAARAKITFSAETAAPSTPPASALRLDGPAASVSPARALPYTYSWDESLGESATVRQVENGFWEWRWWGAKEVRGRAEEELMGWWWGGGKVVLRKGAGVIEDGWWRGGGGERRENGRRADGTQGGSLLQLDGGVRGGSKIDERFPT
jgi:hypothetical protein